MDKKKFVVMLATYFREPLLLDGKPNIRLSTLEHWLGGCVHSGKSFSETELTRMFDCIITKFIPTSINPFPMIPQIIEMCEIQTTDKSKQELARTVADRVIYAILNIGCRQVGSRDASYKHIGELGKAVTKQTYGQWHTVCEVAENESIEVMRSHIRDSVYAFINRCEKGIENQAPELTDLNCKKQLSIGE